MSSRGKDNGRDDRTHGSSRMDDAMLRFAPEHVTKKEFGRRLYQAMLTKGWTQSELARQADISRDKVSTYIRGVTLPTAQNTTRLAKALGVDPNLLMPSDMERAIDKDDPDLEIKRSPGMPGHMTWLRVNRAVSLKVALKIAELLEEENAVNTGRSGGAAAVLPNED